MNKLLLAAAISLATPFAAHAAADFVEGDRTWAGEAELGATLTTGNTDTSSVKGRIGLKHELGNWENQYIAEALYKEDENTVTAERYFGGIQGDYQINDVSYIFINTNYEKDPFTGFDFTSKSSAGYGHRFIDDGKALLKAEVGPGYIYQRLDDESAITEGVESRDSVVAHAVINFSYKISDTSTFKQEFITDWGDKLDGRSESSITANIVGALSMKFAVIVRYNSDPVEGKESTDTETNMTLLYSF
ncbi:YdiY family protein [Shewanella intestini]|uniref:DUF481 domain-containing protein n=1 Tax=Shewanella intestini TaxID=2017544 RepID=A0ABS5I7W9_9GAMM|nr:MULTISPECIES: DUF481 domain-containing protein [Shewanella]MBR9729410.1 DUF481 domain-containing protein [Shewanella intestini]MRG37490.1 DUF481 domain-containing protein [Shewanella sp. XMDDZSB0408]